MDFKNKVALVTGGASGIGETISTQFAQLGANVVIYDMDEIKATSLCDKLTSAGLKCAVYKADVSSYADMQSLTKEVFKEGTRFTFEYHEITEGSCKPEYYTIKLEVFKNQN